MQKLNPHRGAGTLWTSPYQRCGHMYDAHYDGASFWHMCWLPDSNYKDYTQIFCTSQNSTSIHMFWEHANYTPPQWGYLPNQRHVPVEAVSAPPVAS